MLVGGLVDLSVLAVVVVVVLPPSAGVCSVAVVVVVADIAMQLDPCWEGCAQLGAATSGSSCVAQSEPQKIQAVLLDEKKLQS